MLYFLGFQKPQDGDTGGFFRRAPEMKSTRCVGQRARSFVSIFHICVLLCALLSCTGPGRALEENPAPLPEQSARQAEISKEEGDGPRWVAVSAGWSHSAGIQSDGSLWAWGLNSYGQLGNGGPARMDAPVRMGRDSDWARLSVGGGTRWRSRKTGRSGHGAPTARASWETGAAGTPRSRFRSCRQAGGERSRPARRIRWAYR